MSNLYLFENFNNYYNRTFKGARATVHDYPIEEAYGFYGINFYPADNVHTTQMINLQTNAFDMEPDYLLVCEDNTNRIVSRWFVIESKQTRGGQIELSLRRDLIADYFNVIKDSPLFVEKAITTDSDPAIFNKEDMSFNQIKTKEILLKDQSPCAWIVGYYNPEAVTEEPIAVDSEITNAITKPLGTTMAAFLGNYTNFQGVPQTLEYKLKYRYGGGGVRVECYIDAESGRVNKADYLQSSGEGYNMYFSSRPMNADFHAVFPEAVGSFDLSGIGNYHTAAEVEELLSYKGLVKDSNNEVYLINVIEETDAETYTVPITAGQLYNQLSATVEEMPKYRSGIDSGSFDLVYKTVNYTVTAQRQYSYEANFQFSRANNLKCADAPYSIFAIPYGDKVTIRKQDYAEDVDMTKQVAMSTAFSMIRKLGSGDAKILYDIQLLPYCPIQALADGTGEIYLDGLTANEQYTEISTSDKVIGVFFHVPLSRFSFDIKMPSRIYNTKIENETKFYRLCSPNYSGQFEFSAAKNGGVNYYNVDCEYKPFQPYIHINPNFKGLYGQDFNDPRGLICGGDFSLTQISDAWEAYQIQNKNYQVQFDRQIESLDLQQNIQRLNEGVGAGLGTLKGLAGGAIFGGAVGAAVGSLGALAAGGIDAMLNESLRKDARDLTIDQFNYQLGNIKALPYSLTKVSSFNPNNKIFPILEVYEATDMEKEALAAKIIYNGMTINRIGTIDEFRTNFWSYNNKVAKNYIKGRLIRLEDNLDYHMVDQISKELNQGLYFEED